MAHDAIERSLSEHNRALEAQVADLQAILAHLLDCIERTDAKAESNAAKIRICLANSAAATTVASRAIEDVRELAPLAQESVDARALLERVAGAAGEEGQPERKRRCRRKLPPGWGGIVAGAAVAWGLLKAHHKAAAITGAAALLTAASAPMAAQMLPDTDARLMTPVAHHHFRAHRVDPDPVTAAVPPRRRHRSTLAASAQKKRRPSPKGTAAPATMPPPPPPSPVASSPAPSPSPTVTPTDPAPSPAVTPTGATDPGGTPAAVRVLNRMLPRTATGPARWDN